MAREVPGPPSEALPRQPPALALPQPLHHARAVRCVVEAGPGCVLSGADDGSLHVWHLDAQDSPTPTPTAAAQPVHTAAVYGLAVLDDGERVATASLDFTLRVWEVEHLEYSASLATQHAFPDPVPSATFSGHTNRVLCVASLGGGRLVSGSDDKTLKLWDADTDRCLRTLTGHASWVWCVAPLTPATADAAGLLAAPPSSTNSALAVVTSTLLSRGNYSRFFVSGSDDKTLKLWDVHASPAAAAVGVFAGHAAGVKSVVDVGDGRILSASDDRTLKLWDVATRACVGTFVGHTGNVNCVVYLGDGRLVSGSNDNSLKVWDIDTFECLETLRQHTSHVWCLTVLRDKRVVSGSCDATLRVWDLRYVAPRSPPAILAMLHVTPDNARLLSALMSQIDSSITSDDVLACVALHLAVIVPRWPVIKRAQCVVDFVLSRCTTVTCEWFQLNDALEAGRLAFGDLVRAQLGGDPTQRELLALQLDLTHWPEPAREAWNNIHGAAVDASVRLELSMTTDKSHGSVNFERFTLQEQLISVLLQAGDASFSTPGFPTTGVAALDATMCAILPALHPQVSQNPSHLWAAVNAKLVVACQVLASKQGMHLLAPSRSQPCLLQHLSESHASFALSIIQHELLQLGDATVYDASIDTTLWASWIRKLETGTVNLFEDGTPDARRVEASLFSAFAFLQGGAFMMLFAKEAAAAYVQQAQAAGKPSRLVLLFQSRLDRAKGKMHAAGLALQQYLLLGWRGTILKEAVAPADFWVQPPDWQVLGAGVSSASPTPESKQSEATPRGPRSAAQEWESHVAKGGRQYAAMDELMQLVGMEEVKRHAVQMCAMMEAWQELPPAARVPVSLNFSFMGNPGTGKTTVARIFGKLLHQVGVRRNSVFIEKSAASLKRDGGGAFASTVQAALGGVLFIDEAYQLEPLKDPMGRDIVDELLMAAENHREDLSIIVAGYKDEIELKLYAYNSGMISRFDEVMFSDFHDGQLRDIWDLFLRKHEWSVEDVNVSTVAVRRVARQRNTKGFGNARAVRAAFQSAIKAATSRWAGDRTSAKQCLVMEDVIGVAPSRHTIAELDAALCELEAMTGLQEVKAAVHQLVETAAVNYRREIRGQPVLTLALNRLMLGNPGTGKTTVAAIYARILKALGLVSKGSVEFKTASDFIGEAVGQSAAKTRAILDLSKGKVLVIDEAYNLNDNLYGKQVIDTIVEKVSGTPGEDMAVLLLGYEKQMRDMLREQNPGLSRRFNPQHALTFKDYDDNSLAIIAASMAGAEGLTLSLPVLRCIVRTLAQQRTLPNFGNAGAVRNLLSAAKGRMMTRVGAAEDTVLTIEDVVGEDRDAHGGVRDADPLHPVRSLIAAGSIMDQLTRLQQFLAVQRREGRDVSAAAGNWLFLGNPGTGKTTVAKCMGKMLHDLGVLARDGVEITSAADLTGNVVGAAKGLVADAMGRARGGVLFIDEAYELGIGPYGHEAMAKLVELLTLDEYRKGTVVILAGYETTMREMLQRNAGLASRFQRTLRFPDWSADDAASFVMQQMSIEGFDVGAGVPSALLLGFKELRSRPGWANARDATSAWRDRIMFERTKRVYKLPEAHASVTLEDVERGMEDFLASRPRGVPRRQADALQAMVERAVHSRSQPPPVAATNKGAPEPPDTINEPVLSDCELKARQREAEDKERKLMEELVVLRAQEAAARRAAQAAQQRADEEAARKAAEAADQAHQRLQALRKASRVQLKLRQLGLCPCSFEWHDMGDGFYRCDAGGHMVHISELGEV